MRADKINLFILNLFTDPTGIIIEGGCGKVIICDRELYEELLTANREMSVWLQLLHETGPSPRPASTVTMKYVMNMCWKTWLCYSLEKQKITHFPCAYCILWRIVHVYLSSLDRVQSPSLKSEVSEMNKKIMCKRNPWDGYR